MSRHVRATVAVAVLSLAVLGPPVQAQDKPSAQELADLRARAEAGDTSAQAGKPCRRRRRLRARPESCRANMSLNQRLFDSRLATPISSPSPALRPQGQSSRSRRMSPEPPPSVNSGRDISC